MLPVNEEAPLPLQLGNGWFNEPSGAGRAADAAHLGLELAVGSMGGQSGRPQLFLQRSRGRPVRRKSTNETVLSFLLHASVTNKSNRRHGDDGEFSPILTAKEAPR